MTIAQQLRQEGMQKGRQEGREEGRQERAKTMALAMLEESEPIEKIMRYTSLTEAEIMLLQTKH